MSHEKLEDEKTSKINKAKFTLAISANEHKWLPESYINKTIDQMN